MAFTFRIQTRLDGLKKIEDQLKELKPIDRKTADKVGQTVISMMKDMIARGQSPIRGAGRFPAYKNPKKYPGKRKPATPVNLYLTGQFLASLTYRVISGIQGFTTVIGFLNSNLARKKEQGHREGANSQPKRPIIPDTDESLALPIEREVLDIYKGQLERVLKNLK